MCSLKVTPGDAPVGCRAGPGRGLGRAAPAVPDRHPAGDNRAAPYSQICPG